jgi:hypothetical protein
MTRFALIGRALVFGFALLPALAIAQSTGVEPPATPTTTIRLAPGAMIALELQDTLSSRTNYKGDAIRLLVVEDVLQDGTVIIPRGTTATGEVTDVQAKGALGQSGKLEARLLYATVRGSTIRLSGALSARGKSNGAETLGAIAAIGTFPLFFSGKSATIAAGTRMTARIDREAIITAP